MQYSTYIFESSHILKNSYFLKPCIFFVNIVNSENTTCTNSMFRLRITEGSPGRLTVDTLLFKQDLHQKRQRWKNQGV